jgi:nicotinate phosphoribosyltransferase
LRHYAEIFQTSCQPEGNAEITLQSANPKPNPHGFLFTDLYELTMAQLYFRLGIHEKRAQFDYFFRNYPDYGAHQAGYCINAGMGSLLEWLSSAAVTEDDLACLRGVRGRSGERVFADDFLRWLTRREPREGLDVLAIPEGRVVHPTVPLAVVYGPLAHAQIIETAVLNHLNYQTLIATKASRIKLAGQGRPLIEFGMRRAHGPAANPGARAALIGGADYSSNTGMSCALGFAPKGTHAHSMVQAFMALGEGERGAFEAYAECYPDDCLLLVDTVNTLQSGVPNAIRVFEKLRREGHTPVGIRLDSGDLAFLAVRAAQMLNDAGFPDTVIVLSNQIDEHVLLQILRQVSDEARGQGMDPDHVIKRLVYGVGTRLIASAGCEALDGVYKLASLQRDGSQQPVLKRSETPEKAINPGEKRAWRIYGRGGQAVADCLALADEDLSRADTLTLRHPVSASQSRTVQAADIGLIEPLLEPVLHGGTLVGEPPTIEQMRRVRDGDLERLHPGVKRVIRPHVYHVSLSERLWRLKQELLATSR